MEVVRRIRGNEILAIVNTAESRKILETMAGGASEALETKDAKEILELLKKRNEP